MLGLETLNYDCVQVQNVGSAHEKFSFGSHQSFQIKFFFARLPFDIEYS